MIKRLITFQCEICNSAYPGKEAARTCEAQGLRGKVPGIVVGSVVAAGPSYDEHKQPDTAWTLRLTEEEREPFAGLNEFRPLFVVTRIDKRDHDVRYHLYCAAPPWAENPDIFNFRWNCSNTHYSLEIIPEGEVPEAITTWKSSELEIWAPRVARDLL